MPDEAASIEKASEGVTSDFVKSLGLLEIVLGGIALYLRYLGQSAKNAWKPLPGTGHELVDIGLLLCAAALVGKILSLLIGVVMAIINIFLGHKKKAELSAALAAYSTRTGRRIPRGDGILFELVLAIIRVDSPTTWKMLDTIRSNSIIAHGIGLLLIFYAGDLSRALGSTPTALVLCLLAAALIILGCFYQWDRIAESIMFLKIGSSTTEVRE